MTDQRPESDQKHALCWSRGGQPNPVEQVFAFLSKTDSSGNFVKWFLDRQPSLVLSTKIHSSNHLWWFKTLLSKKRKKRNKVHGLTCIAYLQDSNLENGRIKSTTTWVFLKQVLDSHPDFTKILSQPCVFSLWGLLCWQLPWFCWALGKMGFLLINAPTLTFTLPFCLSLDHVLWLANNTT